jgi:hypothetical protein
MIRCCQDSEQIGTLFNTYPEAGAAFTNFNFIDHNSNPIPITNKCILTTTGIIPDFLNKIAIRQLIQPPAIVVKRSTEQIGSFYAVILGRLGDVDKDRTLVSGSVFA